MVGTGARSQATWTQYDHPALPAFTALWPAPRGQQEDETWASDAPRTMTRMISISNLAPPNPPQERPRTPPPQPGTTRYSPGTKMLLSWSRTDANNPHYPRKRSTFAHYSALQR